MLLAADNHHGGASNKGRPANASATPAYRLDIQGLRAIAVLSVVIFHVNGQWLPGGFVGVDIFFVISGFLITGILARELDGNSNSIGDFYRRRILRLFPALVLMLAGALVAGWLLLSPPEFAELGRTVASTMLFSSNFDFLDLSGYFGGDAKLKPLLHTWSLAVEEQFYILFPLLLAMLWRGKRANVIRTIAALAVISLILSSWSAVKAPEEAFYLAPSRAFELLIGALTALYSAPTQISGRLREFAALLGLALIGASLLFINEGMPFPGLAGLPPCLGTALVIEAGKHGDNRVGKWISNRPFLFFGAISYSLYLWHWPVLVFARYWSFGDPPPLLLVASVFIAIIAAWVSFQFVERPIQQYRWETHQVLMAGACAVVVGAAIGLSILAAKGFPQRFSEPALTLFSGVEDSNPRRKPCHQNKGKVRPYSDACLFGSGVRPTLAVWGDSHGAELVVALGERLNARGESAVQFTASACPPVMGYRSETRPLCPTMNAQTLNGLVHDQRLRTVFLAANYGGYPDFSRSAFAEGLLQSVKALKLSGKRVIVLAPIPIMKDDPPAVLGRMEARGKDPASYGVSRVEHDRKNAWVRGLLSSLSEAGAIVVDPTDTLCDQRLCIAYVRENGRAAYFNRNHVSVTGARLLAAEIPLD